MATMLRIHEMVQELDPDEAALMKQRSRIEAAQKLRAGWDHAITIISTVPETRSRAKG